MNHRLLPLGLGVLGLILGVVGAVADVAVLGLVAGLLALLAGGSVFLMASGSRRTGASSPAAAVSVPAPAPTPASTVEPAQPARVGVPAAEPAPEPTPSPTLLDPETGLFNEDYFLSAVETRVSAARRHLRPVAVVLFEVVENVVTQPTPADPVAVADGIRATLREADTACRLNDGRFAFVLEDTPEDGAIWTVERLRRKLNELGTEQGRWAGIACYPAHAFNAAEVLSKAERALAAAKEWAVDRIEVAAAD